MTTKPFKFSKTAPGRDDDKEQSFALSLSNGISAVTTPTTLMAREIKSQTMRHGTSISHLVEFKLWSN